MIDEALFRSIDGGKPIIEWFGFIPDFHDAKLERLELSDGNARLTLECFRMTEEVDQDGYFVLDRHAIIDVILKDVTGLRLSGDGRAIVDELDIDRAAVDDDSYTTIPGPKKGDFVVRWTGWGLEGEIFARNISFSFQPLVKELGSLLA